MNKIILCRGLPASGKSTWAKQYIKDNPKWKIVNKDQLRLMMDDSKWSKANEKFVLDIRDIIIAHALVGDYNIIVDDTNLSNKHYEHLNNMFKGVAEIEIKDFTNVSVEECIKRDQKRQNYVGEKVIRDMYNQFLAPKPEKYEWVDGLVKAIIVDMDGTLSKLNGRNPYDASTCENDLLNEPVAKIISDYDGAVLICSGREDKYKEQTINFLDKYEVYYSDIFMRKSGDQRKDSIIKKEIFDNEIRGKYNIEYCLDDRSQVVSLWRSLGLTCFQVAEGDF